MGLDIEALRLTFQERSELIRQANVGIYQEDQILADTQLAKVAWGIRDWLYSEEDGEELLVLLEYALEQANVKRPASSQAATR